MKIPTMERRECRLKFVRFLHTQYGLNLQTAYAKIRVNRVKEWEAIGIKNCLKEYNGFRKDPSLFYQSVKGNRQAFLDFMNTKGMCQKTASIRFREFNFTELELDGMALAYQKFSKEYPELAALAEETAGDEVKASAGGEAKASAGDEAKSLVGGSCS